MIQLLNSRIYETGRLAPFGLIQKKTMVCHLLESLCRKLILRLNREEVMHQRVPIKRINAIREQVNNIANQPDFGLLTHRNFLKTTGDYLNKLLNALPSLSATTREAVLDHFAYSGELPIMEALAHHIPQSENRLYFHFNPENKTEADGLKDALEYFKLAFLLKGTIENYHKLQEQLPFADGFFDEITIFYTLTKHEPVFLQQVFPELLRVLEPRGTISLASLWKTKGEQLPQFYTSDWGLSIIDLIFIKYLGLRYDRWCLRKEEPKVTLAERELIDSIFRGRSILELESMHGRAVSVLRSLDGRKPLINPYSAAFGIEKELEIKEGLANKPLPTLLKFCPYENTGFPAGAFDLLFWHQADVGTLLGTPTSHAARRQEIQRIMNTDFQLTPRQERFIFKLLKMAVTENEPETGVIAGGYLYLKGQSQRIPLAEASF